MQSRSLMSRRRFVAASSLVPLLATGAETTKSPAGPALRYEHLMDLAFKVGPTFNMGTRLVCSFTEGTFEGPKLKGKLLPPSGEFGATRTEEIYGIDVRLELETDDHALIFSQYRGMVYSPKGASEPYWVTTPMFETASPKYEWLNHIVCVAVHKPVPKSVADVAYQIFQILG